MIWGVGCIGSALWVWDLGSRLSFLHLYIWPLNPRLRNPSGLWRSRRPFQSLRTTIISCMLSVRPRGPGSSGYRRVASSTRCTPHTRALKSKLSLNRRPPGVGRCTSTARRLLLGVHVISCYQAMEDHGTNE